MERLIDKLKVGDVVLVKDCLDGEYIDKVKRLTKTRIYTKNHHQWFGADGFAPGTWARTHCTIPDKQDLMRVRITTKRRRVSRIVREGHIPYDEKDLDRLLAILEPRVPKEEVK